MSELPRRAVVRALAGTAALAAGVLAFGPPAAAADGLELSPSIADTTVKVGGVSPEQNLYVYAPANGTEKVEATATVDLSAFGGKLSLKGDGCTGTGSVYTCTGTVQLSKSGPEYYHFTLTKVSFVATGDAVPARRDVTWHLTTDKSEPADAAQSIDLVDNGTILGDGTRTYDNAKRGDKVALPGRMRNAGGSGVRNPSLTYTRPLTFDPASEPSNCRTRVNGYEAYVQVVCHFDTTVVPGEAYRLSTPIELTIAEDTPVTDRYRRNSVAYTWAPGDTRTMTAADWHQGTGPALTLVPTDDAPTATTPDGYADVTMAPGTDPHDLAITATPLKGKVGDKVDVTFTVTNVGKTMVNVLGTRSAVVSLAYGVPDGLKADCRHIEDFGEIDAPLRGLCTREDRTYYLRAGQSLNWTVTYTVEKAVPGAKAIATFYQRDSESAHIDTWTDDDNGNNVVRVKPDIEGAGPLAKTGVSVPATTGVAGALLLTGGAFLALTRRRHA